MYCITFSPSKMVLKRRITYCRVGRGRKYMLGCALNIRYFFNYSKRQLSNLSCNGIIHKKMTFHKNKHFKAL
jgi:hypothetical protein